jgi:ElaB/YqjD/DUF883 family membrane-anchored ribosome-binding protein
MSSSRLSDTANEAVKGEIDALRDEVKRLADLVSELAKAGSEQATRTFQSAVDRAKDKASDASEAVAAGSRQAADEISRRIEPLAAELSANVERNPLSALFIAAGVGMLIGLLTRSGK